MISRRETKSSEMGSRATLNNPHHICFYTRGMLHFIGIALGKLSRCRHGLAMVLGLWVFFVRCSKMKASWKRGPLLYADLARERMWSVCEVSDPPASSLARKNVDVLLCQGMKKKTMANRLKLIRRTVSYLTRFVSFTVSIQVDSLFNQRKPKTCIL